MNEEKTSSKPSIGLLDATMLVAGSIIGSGIFIVSADITRNAGRAGWLVSLIFFLTCINIKGVKDSTRKLPEAQRPYKAFGYPFRPAFYILIGFPFCTLLTFYKPGFTWPGLMTALLGIPLYYIAVASRKTASHTQE